MKKKRILVVGGAGYIGSHVNKALNAGGYDTTVFDNLSAGHRRLLRWGKFFKGDLARPGDIARCLKQGSFDAVMHFAAFVKVEESVAEPAKYYRNNLANTLNLLDAMRDAGVKKLVFSSTAAVYGEPVKNPIAETHPLAPVNPYGRTKLMCEQVMTDYCAAYGLNCVALRYFNASGADPDGEIGPLHEEITHLIPLVLDAVTGRRSCVRVFGSDYKTPDGTCLRDYIHVADLASAHIQAFKYLQKGGKSGVFNLGNGRGFSVLDVIKAAELVTGTKIPVKMSPRRPGDPAGLVASSAKARKVLGWRPRYAGIETIIKHAWQWHKQARPQQENS